MSLRLAIKLLPAAAFFGYAGLANVALLTGDKAPLPELAGLWTGQITQDIDGLYRDGLPHVETATGLVGAVRYVLLDEGRKGVVVGTDGTLFTAEEARPVAPDLYSDVMVQVEAVAKQMAALDLPLVVAPLPAKLDVLRTQAPDAQAAARQAALYDQFVSDLSDLGIDTVDTRPALSAVADPFLATDTHWSPAGARAVAAEIAAKVAQGDTAFRIEAEDTVSFAGDLVTYVTTDDIAPKLGLLPERVEPYRAVAEADAGAVLDLFGTSGTEGADLVGTSYSANPNWSFAEALKLEMSRDVVNHAVEGQGPFKPMRTYLDQLDPAALPELVIWEIPVRYLTDPEAVAGGQV